MKSGLRGGVSQSEMLQGSLTSRGTAAMQRNRRNGLEEHQRSGGTGVIAETDCPPVQEGIAAVTLSPAPLPPSHGHSANCLQANVNHSHPSTRADQGERQSQQPPSLGWLCSKDTRIKRKETQNSVFSKRPISFTWAPMAQIPHAEVPEERAGAQGLELLPALGSGSRAGAHPGSLMSTGLKPGITSR